jgi:hypothetical protein
MGAHLSHFTPLAAESLQQALAAVSEEQQEAHWVEAQLERKRAPVAARSRVVVFMECGCVCVLGCMPSMALTGKILLRKIAWTTGFSANFRRF